MSSSKAPKLPYISFEHLEGALARMAMQGLPGSLASWHFGASRSSEAQLRSAFRYLGLFSEQDQPTDQLFAVVSSIGTPAYASELRSILRRSYPFLATLDLSTATPGMLSEIIARECSSIDGARKALRFYLCAAKKAGLQLGPRLTYGRQSPRPAKAARSPFRNRKPDSNFVLREFIQKVPAFDDSWPENVQITWLRAMGKLAERL